MAAQLLELAPGHEAKLYYSTMVQDESRHVEAWLRLVDEAGGDGERDPHLDELARMFLDLDTLEEKVFLMQVFFERLIIPRFRLIARSSRGTVLEDLCNRLTIDDGIHHGAGMAYERVLLGTRRPEDEGAADQGREPDAPDLRRARPLAPAGARADRAAYAVARRRARSARTSRTAIRARGVARPRRQRAQASVLEADGGELAATAAAKRPPLGIFALRGSAGADLRLALRRLVSGCKVVGMCRL